MHFEERKLQQHRKIFNKNSYFRLPKEKKAYNSYKLKSAKLKIMFKQNKE